MRPSALPLMRRDLHDLIDPRRTRTHIGNQIIGQPQKMLLIVPDALEINELNGSNGAVDAFRD